jgi:hypothetical protein
MTETAEVPDAAQGTATVTLVNGTRCSAGTGPGTAVLPWAEAKALADAGLACFGSAPPANMPGSLGPVSPP